jgi:hypothetical protein
MCGTIPPFVPCVFIAWCLISPLKPSGNYVYLLVKQFVSLLVCQSWLLVARQHNALANSYRSKVTLFSQDLLLYFVCFSSFRSVLLQIASEQEVTLCRKVTTQRLFVHTHEEVHRTSGAIQNALMSPEVDTAAKSPKLYIAFSLVFCLCSHYMIIMSNYAPSVTSKWHRISSRSVMRERN